MTTIKTVDAKTVKAWLDKNEAIIIDVREPAEYAAKHIPGSTLIPLGVIQKDKLPAAGNKKIVIHCQLGKRGGMACEKLLLSDAQADLYNLEGGIVAWEKAGYAVKQSGKSFLSIDRQTQLTIGTGVMLGLLLGYFFHPGFLLLSAFFAGGLIYAGATGTCGLAVLLSKMPWNQRQKQDGPCKM